MWKTAADISPSDQTILKGILEGFGQVVDINKIDKFNLEVKRIFSLVKTDSEDLPEDSLYQIAYHMSRNRAKHLLQTKGKAIAKETSKEPEKSFVQPIIRKQKQSLKPKLESVVKSIESIESNVPKVVEPIDSYEPPKNINLVIRKAISDGFDFVEGLNDATTAEHLYSEAQKLFIQYINKFDETTNVKDVYETVFRTAKKIAEEIVTANQVLVQEDDRKDMRAKKREETEQAEIERQRVAGVAKIELRELISKMLEEKELSDVTKNALRYFRLIYLDDKRDPEVVHLFPGTSRDQRYQWKARAVRMIAPHASGDARKYIGEKTKRKFAFAPNILLKAAKIFLMRCEDKHE